AIKNNELAFLQSDCLSLSTGQADADDIGTVKKAEALHGHAIDDPPATYITIGVKPVPTAISDAVFRRLGVRPTIAVIAITEDGGTSVIDERGRHIQQLIQPHPGERVSGLVLGQVKEDGIGPRIWATGFYRCLDTEVAGLCDGVV
ncbi:MAG: hypothetical protein ACREP9_06790, partial [Candidatus Dormibacteraceae bacterium]